MISLLKDAFGSAALRLRYQRLARQRVLRLLETHGGSPPAEDQDGSWRLLNAGGTAKGPLPAAAADLRTQARRLVEENPHGRNVLRLLEAYVVGPDCHVQARPAELAASRRTAEKADRLWERFLRENADHFSYREFARRTWRDGECFLRLFPQAGFPPAVRFLDPEEIGPTREHPDSQGILTAAGDCESPLFYLHIDPARGTLREKIPAAEVIHTKINADSNEPRGRSFFAALIGPLTQYERWLEIELVARKLQASVLLWRKVTDGPLAGWGSDGNDSFDIDAIARERFVPGSIITTNEAVDLQFLQPPTHVDDASALGRMLLLTAAAGAGLPEYMLTSDASNANYASTMIAEGPAVKLFQAEQRFFAKELTRLWRMVMAEAVAGGQLPADFLASAELDWSFPTLIARDRPRERYADVNMIQAGVISRAEVARRENVDPALMRAELAAEQGRDRQGRAILADDPEAADLMNIERSKRAEE